MTSPGAPLRVLHCPHIVGGNAFGLARAEREVGLASWSVAFSPDRFVYRADEYLWRPGQGILSRELSRWRLLGRALREFDVVHFNFGVSLLPYRVTRDSAGMRALPRPLRLLYRLYAGLFELRDAAWLRRAGKGIVVTFQGSDARQGAVCRERFAISPVDETEPGYFSPEGDRIVRRRIAAWARQADRVYALNPDLLHVLPPGARFLPYASVDPREWTPSGPPPGERERPVVVHAPSHRGVKGTRFVLDAVRRLEAEGVPLEFVLVEGRTQAEARREYERADLVVDQLLLGWYGALAVEAMALGKPVVCFLREGDLGGVPAAMRAELPLIRATPDTVYEVLNACLGARKGELAGRGAAGRAFVQRWHDPVAIARSLAGDYAQALARRD